MNSKRFAALLKAMRQKRGLTARQLSLRAGLGPNYVANVERCQWVPKPKTTSALIWGLDASVDELTALNAAAGINLTDEVAMKRARREASSELLFIAVNHFYLPRLELPNLLARRGLTDSDRTLIRAAAAAPDLLTFSRDHATGKLSPALQRLMDGVFSDAPLTDVRAVHEEVCRVRDAIDRHELHPGLSDSEQSPKLWRLWTVATLLLGHNHPQFPIARLHDFVIDALPEYSFSVAYFPSLFWHACHAWSFEKVALAHPRRARAQHDLYHRVRAGLSLPDFANLLLDGTPVVTSEDSDRARMVESLWPITRPPLAQRVYHPRLPDGWISFEGPRRPDGVFDYWDRAAFIKRFPLVSIDRAHFIRLARSLDHPYWSAWDASRRATKLAEYYPSPADRFHHVLWSMDAGPQPDRESLPDQIDRLLCGAAANAVARLIGAGDWRTVLAVAEKAELPKSLREVIEAAANREPDIAT